MIEAFTIRYAQALYDCCLENEKLLTKAGFELEALSDLVDENPDLVTYFDSPIIAVERKYEFLAKIIKKAKISSEVHGLLRSIIKRERFLYLRTVEKAYKEMLATEEAGTETFIYSARALTDDEKALLKSRLQSVAKKFIKVKEIVDPSLIGGVRAEIDHKVYDSSIRTNLNLLKEGMLS